MIVIKLQGGLGNQMFQYACGKSLALRLNKELLLDLSFLKSNPAKTTVHTPRNYQLDIFDIKDAVAKQLQLEGFAKLSVYQRIKRRLKLPYKKVVYEDIGQGANQLKNILSATYLDGYWQSEDYFRLHESLIRSVFVFPELDEKNRAVAKRIEAASNSVSLHIRRGDYLNANSQATHGLLPADYYYKALEMLKEKYEALSLFVFSDDIAWVKSNLKLTAYDTFFVDHNHGNQSWKDMALMSKCKHHVLANSSFSWWSAWLNTESNKTVIASSRWFADAGLNEASKRLIPDNWIKI